MEPVDAYSKCSLSVKLTVSKTYRISLTLHAGHDSRTKASGQKGRRTKRPGDGKACFLVFDAPGTRRRDWADSNVECLLECVM